MSNLVRRRREKLLGHQTFVVKHLLSHPEKHGLIVAHAMGSGKTMLAIAVADAFPTLREVLIVAPGHLQAVWEQEFEKYKLQATNIKRFSFSTYDSDRLEQLVTQDLSATLVLLDEGHNIVRSIKDHSAGVAIYRKLQKSGKLLLLSGTPIYDDEIDFPYLVNLAAGTDIITVDPVKFHQAFTKLHLARTAFSGYWRPGFSLLAKYLSTLTFVTVIAVLLRTLANAEILPFYLKPFEKVLGGVTAAASYPFQLVVSKLAPIFARAFLKTEVSSKEFMDQRYRVSSLQAMTAITGTMVILNWIVAKGLGTENLSTRVLSTTKFKPFISKYVSFHKINAKSGDFAKVRKVETNIKYTSGQMQFFLKFSNGLLSGQDVKALLADTPLPQATLFSKHLQSRFDQNIEKGLMIGNLVVDGQQPLKFEGILRSSMGQPTVIYTNFIEEGAQPLAAFLVANKQNVVQLTKSDNPTSIRNKVTSFNEGRVSFAILHPGLTEGLSFRGVRHLHFLEPVLQQATREQIIARGVRFQSHSHLPASERFMTVHTWVVKMSLADFGNKIQQMKFWWKFKSEYLPGQEVHQSNYKSLKPALKQSGLLTPDVIQMTRIATFGENVQALLTALQKYSIEATSKGKRSS